MTLSHYKMDEVCFISGRKKDENSLIEHIYNSRAGNALGAALFYNVHCVSVTSVCASYRHSGFSTYKYRETITVQIIIGLRFLRLVIYFVVLKNFCFDANPFSRFLAEMK